MVVPPGRHVCTGYVEMHRIRLANRSRMAVGDVDAAYRRQLSLGSSQAWPCPVGEWDGDWFVVLDGRHQKVAAEMLGMTHLLVAWMD